MSSPRWRKVWLNRVFSQLTFGGLTPSLRVHFRLWDQANTSFPLEPYIQAPGSGSFMSGVPAGSLVIPVHPTQVGQRYLRGQKNCSRARDDTDGPPEHLKIALIRSLLDLCPGSLPEIALSSLRYSPNITLSFVLLNEDSSGGKYVRSWDVEQAIQGGSGAHITARRQN